jgi:hypothetical protein
VRRCAATGADEPIQRRDVASVSIRRSHLIANRLAGELIHDVQERQDPPVGGLVELEVQGPHP